MLPGSIAPPPPPPPLPVLIGSPFVPSPLPSDPHSSSISSSIAIIVIIVITTVTITACIVILRRGCHRRRFLSPMASAYSSSAEFGMRSSASKDSGTASTTSSVAHSAEGKMKGADLVGSSPVSAVMKMCGVDTLVPSAPSLPAVELLILELLSLPAVPLPGRSTHCIICEREFLPTDVLLVLPVCSHVFHQSCVVKWLRCPTTPSRCPFCYASITIPSPDKTKVVPTFCSDEYDIESQMLVPSSPGEDVAGAVGGYHGWLRSSLDRLSGSWRGCTSNHAAAVVVPVSSRRTTGSPNHGSSGRLGNCLDHANTQKPLPDTVGEEMPGAVRGSVGWLRSLATLSGSWTGHSSSSDEMQLPVTSRHVTETLASRGNSITDSSWSSRWDLEAATPTPERTSFYEYARWFFRSSGK
ncbi:hypothetical protein HU200_024849 [Digitaria exilis]|uniref:RING-type domain-containing protein n=1 Tax=Digitaria exilis TaxID=1010633 RepID=A0A835ETX2_9POAL|nr:hypothetical protein HU200_024849 [Digitaria exilis]